MKSTNRNSPFNKARTLIDVVDDALFTSNSEWEPGDTDAEQRWRHAKALNDAAKARMARGNYKLALKDAEEAMKSLEGN